MSQENEVQEKSDEQQNFEKLTKGLFAVPKSELDAAEREEAKQTRRRTPVKPTAPQK